MSPNQPHSPSPSGNRWPVDQARVDRNWRAITIELDAPRPSRTERLLQAIGFPAHLTRVAAATPALRRAWYLATALVVVIGWGAAEADRPVESLFAMLLIAPLVPVLGVAMAYGVENDPAHETAIATPMRGLRLILTRAAVVLVVSTAVLGLAALLLPGTTSMAFAWIIPALGLTLSAVAMMTFTAPRVAATIVAVVWVLGVLVARGGGDSQVAAFGPAGQATMALVAAVAIVVAVARRDRFDILLPVR
jgi:hypothetical protein